MQIQEIARLRDEAKDAPHDYVEVSEFAKFAQHLDVYKHNIDKRLRTLEQDPPPEPPRKRSFFERLFEAV
jgi:hypothetical protein